MNSAFPIMAGQKREARLYAKAPAIDVFLLLRCFKDVDARDVQCEGALCAFTPHDELNGLSQYPLCDTGTPSRKAQQESEP
ncbi:MULTISPECIES: hypothetical protein [unclassified Bradyrhizobium]|uniref:hypothetical protein n=1 Tax=unclassified Bradyrhizobium TaxID=2631580 RepID=UPI001BA44714|nr:MULTISPECIES: hypothetical protein [unclassified Bradyrhizobium]MBR1223301.1 hypothetical protein [Bradyrhizobium sp. AUGA SZCCT0176]MBR1235208.1 hypothetical protein [Bradyrhizobium sp. AUGA SZCCT0182]MBR1298732.1 hypothetical protein [Bradyrhizobium sp. AUGA SZCCT0042]